MRASTYLLRSSKTDKVDWSSEDGWTVVPLGLLGEIGSLCEAIKKHRRDYKTNQILKDHVREEVGDILWYLCAAARRLGIKRLEWPETGRKSSDLVMQSLQKIVDNASLIYQERTAIRDEDSSKKEAIKRQINEILLGLQGIAKSTGQDLASISDHAIKKNEEYWGQPSSSSPCLDLEYPPYERLPRKFCIHFREVKAGKDSQLIISINGIQLGDRLTDNTHQETGYRYHDVFHMSAAAFLGWSPVFRRMLKRKRKSVSKVDENEDGARAAIIEEAVVSQVYRYGIQTKFRPQKSIDEDLIKLIMEMTTEYECKKLEGRDWKKYATTSIEIFGRIKDGFTGKINFDADSRNYEIIPD